LLKALKGFLSSKRRRIRVRKGRRQKQFAHYIKSLLKGVMLFFAAIFTLLLLSIVALRYINPPTWSWKLHREFDPPTGYGAEVRHQWRDISQIPLTVQLAIVASEDQNFPHHHGVDFGAIQQAIDEAEKGEGLRGASTITQQTVKNLFLWPEKDWNRKLIEGGLALLLELLWDKQRILEVYLNIVEFGPGVYGIQAASDYWYRRPLDRLTINQAARLAAVLPNPWRYRAEPPTPYIAERAAWIEQQMGSLGYAWLMLEN
jgi:monofunctional biosynthetic peptidoglycan transglycosylase